MSENIQFSHQQLQSLSGPSTLSEFIILSSDLRHRKEGGQKRRGRHTEKYVRQNHPYAADGEQKVLDAGGDMELTAGQIADEQN